MSSGNEYNSLGQILAEGGEIALALAIAGGASGSTLIAIINRRIAPITDSDLVTLEDFSRRMVEAGGKINASDPFSTINLDDIPVNPNLFGDEPGGRRLFFSGEFSTDDGLSWYRADINLADIQSKEEMYDELRQEGERRRSDSPGAFKRPVDGGETGIMVRITIAERKF